MCNVCLSVSATLQAGVYSPSMVVVKLTKLLKLDIVPSVQFALTLAE